MFRSIRSELPLVALVIFLASWITSVEGPGVRRPHAAAMPQQVAVEVALGDHHVTSNSSTSQLREQPAATRERATRFIDEKQRITVPQRSSLRWELMIAPVTAKVMQQTLEVPGVVADDPAQTVNVLPPVAGRVVDLKVQLGDRVAQQQELAVVYVAGIVRTQFDSRQWLPELPLNGYQIGFESTGDGAAAGHQRAAIGFEQATAQLRALAAPLGEMQETGLLSLKAPVAGSVIDLKITAGAFLKDLSASMMTIANLETILVTTNIPKKSTAWIATGQPAQVRFPAYPAEDFKGEIRQIVSAFGAGAPDIKARILLRNPNIRLKPNMFAYATFFGTEENVPIVPASALVPTHIRDLVFVEVEPWVFELRHIGIGLLEGGQVIVTSGLKVGERVVVRGGALLLESKAQ